MFSIQKIVLLVAAIHLSVAAPVSKSPRYGGRYSGDKVIRFLPATAKQLKAFKSLFDLSPDLQLDFWTDVSETPGQPVDIHVSPDQEKRLIQIADLAGVQHAVVIEDVQEAMDEEMAAPVGAPLTWAAYHRTADIYEWMDAQVKKHPRHVSVSQIGVSTEGRPIRLMRINVAPRRGVQKIGIFLQSLIHPREWIAGATTTWMINELLNNRKYSMELEKFDIHFVPVVNPDGYEYTHEEDRFWRKTRSKQENGCIGVDANRNFNASFGEILHGNSPNPCHQAYHGPAAHSEPEVKAIVDYITKWQESVRGKRIHFFIDYHAYGKFILLNWVDKLDELPADYADLHSAASAYKLAVSETSKENYVLGTGSAIMYTASGSAMDWTKRVAGIKYSQTVELRPALNPALSVTEFNKLFIQPEKEIVPCAKENLAGLLAEANVIRKRAISG